MMIEVELQDHEEALAVSSLIGVISDLAALQSLLRRLYSLGLLLRSVRCAACISLQE